MPPGIHGTRRLRPIPAAVLLGLLSLLAWFFLPQLRRVREHHTGDFGHFYHAARAMAAGEDIYSSWSGGYIYPPLLAFVYAPFARLPEEAASLTALVFNVALVALASLLASADLARRLGAPPGWRGALPLALGGLLLVSDKVKCEIQMWQTNALVLFLLAAALRLLDSRPSLAGAALGFAFNIKYLTLPLLPYLLLRGRFRAAGSFVATSLAFALLPALATGWGRNLGYLAVAYRGLFRLFGSGIGEAQAANVEDIRDTLSVSVTSGFARLLAPEGPAGSAFAVAALVALACLALAAWMYHRAGFAMLYRRDGDAPGGDEARVLTAVEYCCLVALTLAFSPQTNTRHLVLLLPAQVAAVTLLLHARAGVARVPLLLGSLVLALGVSLPPPGLAGDPLLVWRLVGGACWCALPMALALLWTGLEQARRQDNSRGEGRLRRGRVN